MALGKVTTTTHNTNSGDFTTVERQFLYLGHAGKNAGETLYIDQTSDLDELLGVNTSKLKTAIQAARLNAGTNWTAIAMPRPAAGDWQVAFATAMNEGMVCEAVVLTDDMTTQEQLNDVIEAQTTAENRYGRYVFMIAHGAALSTTWSAFIADFSALQDGIAADGVVLIPEVYNGWCGAFAGRLAHEAVSIADSPMRVASGSVVGVTQLPVDADGIRYNMSHAKALNDQRGSVPQVYADYDGIYCSDGATLAAEGSDFAVIENLRVNNKVKRQVRLLAITKIADRTLNSTPISISSHETWFMRPIINMSKGAVFNGTYMPGEVKPPQEGDISITWPSRTELKIYINSRPYNAAKSIGCVIGLDLTSEV